MSRRSRIIYRLVDAYAVSEYQYEVQSFRCFRKAMACLRSMAADAKGTDSHDAYWLHREVTGTMVSPIAAWQIESGKIKRIRGPYFRKRSRMDRRAAKRNQRLTYKGQPYVSQAELEDFPF